MVKNDMWSDSHPMSDLSWRFNKQRYYRLMCWCVFCVIEATDWSDCQYTDNKMERQQRNTVSKHKDTRILLRRSPYSLGLRLQPSFQWWPCFIVPLAENYNAGTQCEFSWSRFCLAGWFLDSPSHWSTQTLPPTSSVTFWSIVESSMWFSTRTDPLWDGSDLSSLWCSTFPLVN